MYSRYSICLLLWSSLAILCLQANAQSAECSYNGHVENGFCVCDAGFSGRQCESCTGRTIITSSSGVISNGAADSRHESGCIAILQPTINANESLFVEFINTRGSCGDDLLNAYDGTSLESPRLATFNGISNTGAGMNPPDGRISESGTGSKQLQRNLPGNLR